MKMKEDVQKINHQSEKHHKNLQEVMNTMKRIIYNRETITVAPQLHSMWLEDLQKIKERAHQE